MCLLKHQTTVTLTPASVSSPFEIWGMKPWHEQGVNYDRDRTFCSNNSSLNRVTERGENGRSGGKGVPNDLKKSAQWSWLYGGGLKRGDGNDEDDPNNRKDDKNRKGKRGRKGRKEGVIFHISGAGITEEILKEEIKVYLGPDAELYTDTTSKDWKREMTLIKAHRTLTGPQLKDLKIKASLNLEDTVEMDGSERRAGKPRLRKHEMRSSCANCEECLLTKYWFREERLTVNSLTGRERKALLVG